MCTLRFILGDQLSHTILSLAAIDRDRDIVLMVEVGAETSYVPHHKQKIAFILAAMRHFAQELRDRGITVRYVTLDDPENTHNFRDELCRAIAQIKPEKVVVCEPGEYRVEQEMKGWAAAGGVPVEILPDDRFFCSRERFAQWAHGRKSLRLEYFYRQMRKDTGVLMAGKTPVGGQWNYDKENRKALPKTLTVPPRRRSLPDAITQEVLGLVSRTFPDNFGTLDAFWFATTHGEAQAQWEHFREHHLPRFGDFQDAMAQDEPFLFHSLISAYLNVGLLDPREVVAQAEQAYHQGTAPLNAVEGFIRQILGWREYVRGLYWLKMPDYGHTNALGADRPLPDFYWTGKTNMNCMAQAIAQTRDRAYAHHIQRLMVTGNFALLAGLAPQGVEAWYLAVYADAFEWVELPNTHGMALYADGGIMASKPYGASGKYIDRMSNYCQHCCYNVKESTGPQACPFNYLYWNFLITNEPHLRQNGRMALIYRQKDRMDPEKLQAMAHSAATFLANPDRY